MGGTIRGWSFGAALATLFFAPGLFAATSDEIKSLLEQDKAAAAYAEGKKHPEELGDPAFDFFFGIAAINAGHPGEGVLALERYLLVFPDNISARLQLARGYFELGDDAQARLEFEELRKMNPPADTAAAVDRFLDAIRLRQTRYTVGSGAFVELGIGRDTNVNAGPASANIFLPGFGLQPLDPNSQKKGDEFGSVAAGGYVSYPIRPGVTLFANGQGERKFHRDSDDRQFELGIYNGGLGASIVQGANLYRFGLNYGVITVGSSTYRTTTGGSAEWQHQLDGAQSFSLGAQFARLDYDDANSPRDADFVGFNAGYKRTFNHPWQPVLNLGLNAGVQRSRTDHDELVPRTVGASAAVTFAPAEKWGAQLGYTHQSSDYRGPDFFAFPDKRRDKYDAGNVALTYLYSRNISIRGEALFSKNRSNADAYEFPRDVYSLKVRYDFK